MAMRLYFPFVLLLGLLLAPASCDGPLAEGGDRADIGTDPGGALYGGSRLSGGGLPEAMEPPRSGGLPSSTGGVTVSIGSSGAAAGEGGAAGEAPTPAAFECTRPLGAALTEHACLHARLGPFEAALAHEEAPYGAWLGRPHTAYQVVSEKGYGWVRYRAPEDGFYAAFVSQAHGFYRALPQSVPVLTGGFLGDCEELSEAFAFSALAGQEVRLELASPSTVVIEPMAAFDDAAWGGSCGCALPNAGCGAAVCCEGTCADGRCPGDAEEPVCAAGLLSDGDLCAEGGDCCSGSCDSVCIPRSECRSSGPCVSDNECCLYCHDGDHCH